VIVGSREHTLRQPQQCADWLNNGGVVEHVRIVVQSKATEMATFEVEFDPPPRVALPGFPAEGALVFVARTGDPVAVPIGPPRQWHHRYPREPLARVVKADARPVPLMYLVGGLCLWYPDDPEALRWIWEKGIDDYLRILRRHLWYEEFWRRTGFWPVEDAPHGRRPDGERHPILSEHLRRAS